MRRTVAAALAGFALSSASLAADPVEDFYKDKQLRLIVGVTAGDGYDLWSRLVARHMAGHIPGRPTIVVQNMPGAGMITATNYLYTVAPRDGTAFGSISRSLPTHALLERPNIRFDPRQFGWIGSPETVNRVCTVSPSANVKTIDDVFKQETVVGGIGAGMTPTFLPTLLNNLVATKFRVVEGYGSASAVFLAIERREVDGICMASSTLLGPRSDLIEKGVLRVLFSMEAKPMTAWPNVPTMFDRLQTQEQRQIVSFVNAALEYGRPFVTPPGVPAARLAVLQAAFRATLDDPEFLAEAGRMKYRITYTSPDELKELTERLYATPRAIIENAAAMMPNE
jgi:tripartite-type tricarboxylate transporter receptor subunit TctC